MEAGLQEARFVRSRNSQDYVRLQSLTGEVLRLCTSLTQKLMLAQSQCIFEQGERSGKLLAWLSREQSGGCASCTYRAPLVIFYMLLKR